MLGTIINDGQPGRWPGGGGGGAGIYFPTIDPGDDRQAVDGRGYARVTQTGTPSTDVAALGLSALLIASNVVVDKDDGLAQADRARLQWCSAPTDSATLQLAVLCVIEAGQLDQGVYRLKIDLRAPSGEQRGSTLVEVIVLETGAVVRIPVAVPLTGNLESGDRGLCQVVAQIGDRVLGRAPLTVRPE